MAIEVTTKQKTKETTWTSIAFYALLAIFLVFAASYFVLAFYEKGLARELEKLEKDLTKTATESQLEKDIIAFQKRAQDTIPLLESHSFPTKIFEFLEKNTYPQVWFRDLKVDLGQGIIIASGNAANFEVLAQQVRTFEREEQIKNVMLSKVSAGRAEGITFDLRLTFDSAVLK